MLGRLKTVAIVAATAIAITMLGNWYEVHTWLNPWNYHPEIVQFHYVVRADRLHRLAYIFAWLVPSLVLRSKAAKFAAGMLLGASLSNLILSPAIWREGTPDYISAFGWLWNLADLTVMTGCVVMGYALFDSFRLIRARASS